MNQTIQWLLRNPKRSLLTLALLTVAFAALTSRAQISSDIGDMILGDMPEYQQSIEWSKEMGGDLLLLIGLEDAAPDSEVFVALTNALAKHTLVKRVISPVNVPPAFGFDFLTSPDGHAIIELECQLGDAATLEKTPAFIEEIKSTVTEYGYDESTIHFGGIVAVLAAVQNETKTSLSRFAPMCMIALLVMTWILMRRLWPVLITAIVGVLSVIWMAGFAIAIDPNANIIIAVAPALMFLIAFADVVHIYCAHERKILEGLEPHDAVRQSATDVGRACLFTSVTTLLGFSGMLLIDVPSLRRLGLVMGFGVAAALIIALVITPLILNWKPNVKPRTSSPSIQVANAIVQPALRMPRRVILAFLIISAIAIVGISRINIETDVATRMTPETQIRKDMAFFDQNFGGIGLVELHVQWDERSTIESLAPAARALANQLNQRPDVTRTVSLLQYADALPALALQTDIARTLISTDQNKARILIQTRETGMMSGFSLGNHAVDAAQRTFGEHVSVQPSGAIYLGGLWLERHVASEGRALVITLAVIAVTMILIFRSIRIGIVAMLPNIFPLLILGAILGFFFTDVDSDLAAVAFVAIGLAVDDTIHILSRCQLAAAETPTREGAIKLAMQDAGRGVVITSLVFSIAAAPLALSQYQTFRDIGLLLPITMLAALAADVLLLPALLRTGLIPLPVGQQTAD